MTTSNKRRSRRKGKYPKGAVPLPGGGYALTTSSRDANGRTIRITGIVREEPDLESLAKAMIQLAEDVNKIDQN